MILGDESSDQVLTKNFFKKSCPSPKSLFPESIRKPLREAINQVCPRTASAKRISALEFRVRNYLWLKVIFVFKKIVITPFK